jgi:hypothetical protein
MGMREKRVEMGLTDALRRAGGTPRGCVKVRNVMVRM